MLNQDDLETNVNYLKDHYTGNHLHRLQVLMKIRGRLRIFEQKLKET